MADEAVQTYCERIIREFPVKACLTLVSLSGRFDLTRDQLSNAVGKLIVRGLVERHSRGCYQLTKAGEAAKKTGVPAKPKIVVPNALPDDSFRQRLWACMRMSGTFTVAELVTAASWPVLHAEGNALVYIRGLKAAGYVIELPKRQTNGPNSGHGRKRFRLIRNTGPVAPEYRAPQKIMRDLNTKEDVLCAKQA